MVSSRYTVNLTTGVSYGIMGNRMKNCFLSIHTIHPPLVPWLVLVHSGLQSERQQSQPKAKLVVWYWSTKCIVDHLCWSPICMVLKSLLKQWDENNQEVGLLCLLQKKRVMTKFLYLFVCTFNYNANLECKVFFLLVKLGACLWVQFFCPPTKSN
jgi:hypothetical protein